MRKWNIASIIITVLVISCKEVPPFIDYSTPPKLLKDTTYILTTIPPQDPKNVLIEDISGVRCINCPDGNVEAKRLKELHSERVLALTLFPNILTNFTKPYPDGDTMNTDESENIVKEILGVPTGLPNGAVDRKKFNTDPIVIPLTKWEAYTNEQLLTQAKVNTELTLEPDSVRRKIRANVKLTFTEAFAHPVFVTIIVTENEIISPQLTTTGKVLDYEHHNVLRKCVTTYNGLKLGETIEKGRVFEKGWEIDIPTKWKFKNCTIMVLVNLNEADNKEILQCTEKSVE